MNRKIPEKKTTLIWGIICSVGACVYLFFFLGSGTEEALVYKIAALVLLPVLVGYFIYKYFLEIKDDRKFDDVKRDIADGTRFDSVKAREDQLRYEDENPFELPDTKGMKYDMLKRCHKRKGILWLFVWGFLFFGDIAAVVNKFVSHMSAPPLLYVGILLFGVIFYAQLSVLTGSTVKKWLKQNSENIAELEHSYMGGKIVTHVNDTVNLGMEHIFVILERKVYAFRYEDIESVMRYIVRQKNYTNGSYDGDEYKYYANIRLKDGRTEVKAELNEYQVGMVIEEYHRISGTVEKETEYSTEANRKTL